MPLFGWLVNEPGSGSASTDHVRLSVQGGLPARPAHPRGDHGALHGQRCHHQGGDQNIGTERGSMQHSVQHVAIFLAVKRRVGFLPNNFWEKTREIKNPTCVFLKALMWVSAVPNSGHSVKNSNILANLHTVCFQNPFCSWRKRPDWAL